MLEFETVIDLESNKERNCYVFLRTNFYKLYAYAIVILATIYILYGIMHSIPLLDEIFIIAFVAIFTRYIFLRLPKKICAILVENRSEDFPLKIKYVLNEDGFQIKKGAVEHIVKWSEVISIKETEIYIFFGGKRGDWFSVYKKLISTEVLSSIKSFIQENPELSAKFIPYNEKIKEPIWTSWITKI